MYIISDYPDKHFTYNELLNSASCRDFLFLDIETTGLSASENHITVAGIMTIDESPVIKQFIAECCSDEKELLRQLSECISSRRVILSYNSRKFEIPFIRKRCSLNGLGDPFVNTERIFDLYRTVRPFRDALGLSSCSQQAIEELFGYKRTKISDGKEPAALCREWLYETGNRDIAPVIDHNKEDLNGLLSLTSVLQYNRLLTELPAITSVEADVYKGFCGSESALKQETVFLLEFDDFLPVPVTQVRDHCYLCVTQNHGVLKVPMFSGTLKYFYGDYRNYWFFPEMDQAIHKSAAVFAEKSHRIPCTPQNCFQKKESRFIPSWELNKPSLFRKEYSSAERYQELNRTFLSDKKAMSEYVLQTIRHIFELS